MADQNQSTNESNTSASPPIAYSWRRLRPIPNLAPSSERWLRSGLSWQKPPTNRPAMTPGAPLVRSGWEGCPVAATAENES
jgi:hypothetical protein